MSTTGNAYRCGAIHCQRLICVMEMICWRWYWTGRVDVFIAVFVSNSYQLTQSSASMHEMYTLGTIVIYYQSH